MNESNLHEYQRYAVRYIIEHPACCLFLDLGLGKTISTLTAIKKLMDEYFEVSKVLVIAPKRVAETTWSDEVEKWEHLKGLRVSKILGTEKRRIAAFKTDADVYIINRENVEWLVSYWQGYFPFDMVVIDEMSSFKSAKARRFKALRLVRPKVARVVGLTGTPAPNGLMDLWSQIYLLDMGERLGKTITGYRQKYFRPGRTNGQVVFDYRALDGSERAIYDKISDICISMKAKDYLELPERMDRDVKVRLSETNMKKYIEFEKEQILRLPEEETGDVSALNAAALSNKLLQFANGAVYNSERGVHEIHAEKLEALAEIVEAANGQPVLVFYAFKHDLYRIQKRLRTYRPVEIGGSECIRAWNRGEIRLLLAHPASAGHGLNLQAGGNIIVWYSLPWSSELYLQANARLYRQGQFRPVIIHKLIAEGTIDEDVVRALDGKIDKQEALMRAVKARIEKYRRT